MLVRVCLKCGDLHYAKDLCRKHYRQWSGINGGYRKEYEKAKRNPHYKDMKSKADKKYQEKIKANGTASERNKSKWEKFSSIQENLDKKNRRHRKYYAKNKENPEFMAKKRNYLRDLRAKTRKKVLSHYSPDLKCKICNFNDERALVIDHIANDGTSHKKILNVKGRAGSYMVYRDIIKNNYPAGYQVLCWNCNYIKEYERRIGLKPLVL